MYKVPSISRSNQWFGTVCGLDHGMHSSTQYSVASHGTYLWQLTPRSLLPQSPHLGTEPLFLVYKYTRRPPGVFELWYGINVCTYNVIQTQPALCTGYTHPPTLTPTLSQSQPEWHQNSVHLPNPTFYPLTLVWTSGIVLSHGLHC